MTEQVKKCGDCMLHFDLTGRNEEGGVRNCLARAWPEVEAILSLDTATCDMPESYQPRKESIMYQDFLAEVREEVGKAREKFPDSQGVLTALTEEVGEVAKAMLDEPWMSVRKECVQVAAMALRLAEEGDPTLTEVRRKRATYPQGIGPTCPYLGCPNPCGMKPPCPLCYE